VTLDKTWASCIHFEKRKSEAEFLLGVEGPDGHARILILAARSGTYTVELTGWPGKLR